MRNLTRFLAMALTILMIAGCFSVAALAYADGPFVNYDDEIAVMTEMGLLKGYAGTDNFGYGNNITRREACILFARVLTGRTDAEYAAANFMGAANNTIFADLDATGDYYGAINLANNANLIKGYTEDGVTKFNPNGTITYQDFLTICVRLYYSALNDVDTIAELDKGYPWTYVTRAIALDITDGIVDTLANGAAITRGVAAKAVYNTLFEAELETGDYDVLAAKYFGADVVKATVVLTGIDGYQLTDTVLPAVGGYATVAAILPNGALAETPYYTTVDELLGDKADEAYNYIGASFDIITINNGKTLVKSDMNTRTVLKDSAVISNLIFNKVKYTLVNAFTAPIFNTGANWFGQTELILKDLENSFATITDAAALKPFTNADGVATAPKYAELVGYDDNDDGIMDRAFYASYAVGTLSVESEKDYTDYADFLAEYPEIDFNGNGVFDKVYNMTAGAYGDAVQFGSYENGWGEAGSWCYNLDNRANAKDGDLVLYYYNPVADMIVVDKVYAVSTGVITGYDFDAQTITVMPTAESDDFWFENYGKGTTYSYAGIFNLEGATNADAVLGEQGTTAIREALNQEVKFVLDDGVIIAFWGNTPADDYYIFDKFINVDMNGWINIRVMNADGLYEIISANTVNNMPYWNFTTGIFGFAQGDVIRVISDDVTGRLNIHTNNNLGLSTITVMMSGEEKNDETLYKADGLWWKDLDTALRNEYFAGQNRDVLPKRLIVEDDAMGLVVLDIENAKNGATISFNYDALGYEIADGVYYFRNGRECHQNVATLGNYLDATKPGYTELLWGTNGISTGNVWDVVYFDGSLDASITSTANKYGVVYTYVDKAGSTAGFFSLVKPQDSDVAYTVKSFNKTMGAGFYTLIKDVDGNIWFGDEIEPGFVSSYELTRAEIEAMYPTAEYNYRGIKGEGFTWQNNLASGNNWRTWLRTVTGISDLDYAKDVNAAETTYTVTVFHGTGSGLDSIFYVDHGITDSGLPSYQQKVNLYLTDADVVFTTYDVTVAEGIENGTVTTDVTTAIRKDVVTITVTPAEGYEIEAVTVNGTAIEAVDGAYTYTVGRANVEVSATFAAIVVEEPAETPDVE